MLRRFGTGELLPAITIVFAAIQPDRGHARIHDPSSRWMKGQRPHHRTARGKVKTLPSVAAIGTAIRAILGARVNDVGLRWMDGESTRLHVFGEPGGKRPPLSVSGRSAKKRSEERR